MFKRTAAVFRALALPALVALLASSTGLSGCKVQFAGNPSQAVLIKPGSTVDGRLDDRTPENWFKIEVVEGTRYYIETFNPWTDTGEDRLNTTLTLLRLPDDVVTGNDDNGPELPASAIYWRASASETCYIRVSRYGAYRPSGTYSLRVTTTRPVIDDLALIPGGSPTAGRLTGAGHRNWFSFEAKAGRSYGITTSDLSEGCDTIIFLRDGDLIELGMDDDSGLSDYSSSLTHTAGYSGTHYVEVLSHPEAAGTYLIRVTTGVPSLAEDLISDPVRLVAGGPWVQGRVPSPKGTGSWYEFEAVAGTNYYIETRDLALWEDMVCWVTAPDYFDTFLTLLTSDLEVLHGDDDGGAEHLASAIYWRAPFSGLYYLRVSQVYAAGTYYIGIGNTPPRPTVVHSLEVNAPGVSGTLTWPGQRDWYSFQAESGRAYSINTFHLSNGCDTMIYLRDRDYLDLAFNNDLHENDAASSITSYTAEYTGIHYVVVLSSGCSTVADWIQGTYWIQVIEQ